MNQTLRIIGGRYRGKKIRFPNLPELRPTSDRIRETLFNWLMHDIRNARCLDAFAGSGALGFEAFSRGAAQVTFIESALVAAESLRTTVAEFNTSNLSVLHTDIRDYLSTSQDRFDIIFFDPPFNQPDLLRSINNIADLPLLPGDGLLYLETPQQIALPIDRWEEMRLKQAGSVTYGLYRKKS